MTTKKIKTREKIKEEISAKQVGQNLLVIIDGKKYSKRLIDAESRDRIKNKILLFNKRNSKTLKDELLDIFEPSRLVKEKEISKEKGIKSQLKSLQKDIKSSLAKTVQYKKKIIEKAEKISKKPGSKVSSKEAQMLIVRKDGQMVMKGFEGIAMPDLLVKRLEEFLNANQSIKALLNFWLLCLLNPNEIARTKLFDYLSHHNLTITPSGYIVTFRMVKTTEEANIYTDSHTGKMKYTIGTAARIPREDCDEDGSKDCSKGLHTGAPKFIGIVADKKVNHNEGNETVGDGYGIKYVTTKAEHGDSYGTGYDKPVDKTKKFDNQFGNQAVMCYINPAHVVSVPNSDTRKMRSCEIYFAKLVTPEEVIDMVEKDYLLYDDDYNRIEFEHLKELLKNKELKEYITSKVDTGKKVEEMKKKLEDQRISMKFSSDNINQNLSIIELKEIIKRRNIYLK